MTERPKILITGATGMVGRQVVSQLLDAGAAVRALARDPGSLACPAALSWCAATCLSRLAWLPPWKVPPPCSSCGRSPHPKPRPTSLLAWLR